MCQTYRRNDFKIREQVTKKKSHLLKVTFTISNTKSNPHSLQKTPKGRKLVTEALTHPFTKPKFDSNVILHICTYSFLTKIISRIQSFFFNLNDFLSYVVTTQFKESLSVA